MSSNSVGNHTRDNNSMYPSSNDKLCERSPAFMSQGPLEISQVVPGQSKERSEVKKRRLRPCIWSYHCQVSQQQQAKTNQVVPEQSNEEAENRLCT